MPVTVDVLRIARAATAIVIVVGALMLISASKLRSWPAWLGVAVWFVVGLIGAYHLTYRVVP